MWPLWLGSKPLTPDLAALALTPCSFLHGMGLWLPSLPRGGHGAGSWGHLHPREPHMVSARVWHWRCESVWQLPLGSWEVGPPQASSHWGPPAEPPWRLREPFGAVPLLQVLQDPPLPSLELPLSQGAGTCSQAGGLRAAAHTWSRQAGWEPLCRGHVEMGCWVLLGALESRGTWEIHLPKGLSVGGHFPVLRRGGFFLAPVQGDEWYGEGRGPPCAGDPGVTLDLPLGGGCSGLSHVLVAKALVGYLAWGEGGVGSADGDRAGATHETHPMGISL